MLPNTPPMLEAHFGVPMAGAVLNTINIRLEPATIAYILRHGRAKVLLTDSEFAPTVAPGARASCERATAGGRRASTGVSGQRRAAGRAHLRGAAGGGRSRASRRSSRPTSGRRSASTTPRAPRAIPRASWSITAAPISNAIGQALANDIGLHPVYLWTLPMFHCNGWTFTWGVTLQAGTHVCLRKVEAGADLSGDRRASASPICAARRS